VFVDQVTIHVKAGDGGSGCVSFRREKYVPRGGPNGGDGGDGGDVVLLATDDVSTLLDLKYQQRYALKHGEHGRGKDQHGARSPELVIRVPVGTLVRDVASGEVLADLTAPGQRIVAAKGGRGGRGNARFATPTHRAPRTAEPGQPGEERLLQLELKLMADVGLVGFPNAGKSTFLARVSAARPKVADYPFTTLEPHLGLVRLGDQPAFVIADIPGLIEGAHRGRGLGTQFLRHIERTAFLLYLIDVGPAAERDPVQALEMLRAELAAHNAALLDKPAAVAANKIDVAVEDGPRRRLDEYCRGRGYLFYAVSGATGAGVQPLLVDLGRRVADLRRARQGAA
jgi:GTP-binding protein